MSAIIRKMSMESGVLRSKFRGSLLGSLLGDCLGAPFEGDSPSHGDRITIQKYFDKLEDPSLKTPFRPYTDDTAMMKSMGKFLIDKPEADFTYLAKLFVKEFFSEPQRGYGAGVGSVFQKLKNSGFKDVFKPASEQFDGSGSLGNGGAMRVAPVALFFHQNYDLMLEVAEKATRITHTNLLGVYGALLQCIAVQQALLCDPKQKIDPEDFCDQLCQKMNKVEKREEIDDIKKAPGKAESLWQNVVSFFKRFKRKRTTDYHFFHKRLALDDIGTPYQIKLKTVKQFLARPFSDDHNKHVVFELGNNIGAYDSVPTAIYCFLRAQNEIPTIQTDNIFRRTIQYAITLGGDTDTIACMAGAIAGAYLGEEAINRAIINQCEDHKEIVELADDLYEASCTS